PRPLRTAWYGLARTRRSRTSGRSPARRRPPLAPRPRRDVRRRTATHRRPDGGGREGSRSVDQLFTCRTTAVHWITPRADTERASQTRTTTRTEPNRTAARGAQRARR